MLADNDSAILIEPNSRDFVVRSLAKAMDALAVDPDQANRLAGNARRIAERRFTWENAVGEWQDAYPPIQDAGIDDLSPSVPKALLRKA
jgi:glycosyltransferase involved in cell wall biosynthesis